MQLFVDNSFFVCLILLSIPAFLLGFFERRICVYGLLVSLFFIWCSMGANKAALFFLITYLAGEYLLALAFLKIRAKTGRKRSIYYIFLLLSILPLCLNKFVSPLAGGIHIFGFLGISYMTFKTAQVIIQIYDEQIDSVRVFEYLYLMIFFPAITSGPIDRSERFKKDIRQIPTRADYLEMAGQGVYKILLGVLYKNVLGAAFYQLMQWYGMKVTLKSGLIYMYTYGFYLFFDFAGYSLMAIGAAYIFGVKMPENFNKPFLSLDMKDFWDRWHITLSHWFRDFVFSRITMDIMKTRLIKNRLVIASIVFFINMGIMGFWHGSEPHYIAYGLYHGFLLSLTEVYQKKSKFYKKHKKETWFKCVEWFITFHLVMIGFFLFSGRVSAYLG